MKSRGCVFYNDVGTCEGSNAGKRVIATTTYAPIKPFRWVC
jgi:hypothetical protein